jgi:hypothetical protein
VPVRHSHGQRTRVRGERVGPAKYENVGKSQPVLIMIRPVISPRPRTPKRGPPGVTMPPPPPPGTHLPCAAATAVVARLDSLVVRRAAENFSARLLRAASAASCERSPIVRAPTTLGESNAPTPWLLITVDAGPAERSAPGACSDASKKAEAPAPRHEHQHRDAAPNVSKSQSTQRFSDRDIVAPRSRQRYRGWPRAPPPRGWPSGLPGRPWSCLHRAFPLRHFMARARRIRVRVERLGSHNCGVVVGKSQSVPSMINPSIFTTAPV